MTESYPTDRASLERDSDIDYFIASGPGGQHRNKVETGVRLEHRQRVVAPRKPTRPTAASRVRRLAAKRRTALIKKQRATPVDTPD